MIKNYLKVAFRAILRNKLSSFINIFGLALAMACCLLIYIFVKDELAYDRYNANAENIYRLTRDFVSPDGSVNLHLGHVAPPFGPLLKNDFSEFDHVARTLQNRFTVTRIENGAEKISSYEDNGFYAEPDILKIFTIPVVQGNAEKALTDPFTMMISETAAKKYFGNESPVGKTLRIGGNVFDITINGVFKNLPAQSHWHPDLLVAFSTLNDSSIYGRRGLETNFGNNSFSTYALANEAFNLNKVSAQFPAFLDKHMPIGTGPNAVKPSSFTHLYLQKVTDIHLHSQLDSEVETNGSMKNIYMMSVIGLFIILIACFNFINLSTARATKRAKEVGMRKVVGAGKHQLISQYLSESVLIALFALVVAVIFAFISVGWLNAFTSKSLSLTPSSNIILFIGLIGFALFVGILAGIYPAFIVSSYRPAVILKGQQGAAKGKAGLRKFLVVAQFAISIVLIIATMITSEQLQFLNDRQLGYNKDQVINVRYFRELASAYDAFYNELLKQSSIRNASRSSRVPTGRLLDSQGSAQIQKGDSLATTNVVLKNIRVDEDFFDTYEIALVAGRNFSKDIPTDDSLAFVLNESAVRLLGFTPQNIMDVDFQYGGIKGRVIGVVKDFHFESLHEEIAPILFQESPNYNRLSIKLAGDETKEGIAHIEKLWKEFIPNRPFEFSFLSQQYAQLYDAEQRQGQLFTIFSAIAILIACLGLFGLATFNTLQRVKEIGIRKVLGASVPNIVQLLSREIIILVIVANVIAWPVAWYFMDQWLDTFAYRIGANIWLYILAGFTAIFIALITVGFQTVKAAMTNPANTLRYE